VAGVDRMTSVDSNVILAAVAQREEHHAAAVQLLRDARAEGPLFISPVVYAELMASTRPAAMQDFLAMARISVAWSMPMEVWDLAGRSFCSRTFSSPAEPLPLAEADAEASPLARPRPHARWCQQGHGQRRRVRVGRARDRRRPHRAAGGSLRGFRRLRSVRACP
jgi:hypothetical protein